MNGEATETRSQTGTRVFVAGVGNPWLRDLDFGPMFVRRVADLEWPADVVVEDAATAAHRVMHRLQELTPERVIFVSGFPRGDPPGTIRRYTVEGELPDDEEIMTRMGESAGGVIDVDHTIIINRYYKTLPEDTVIIEVEAADTSFGTGFSAEVEASMDQVIEMVREEIAR